MCHALGSKDTNTIHDPINYKPLIAVSVRLVRRPTCALGGYRRSTSLAEHPDQIRRHDDLTIAAGGCGTSA